MQNVNFFSSRKIKALIFVSTTAFFLGSFAGSAFAARAALTWNANTETDLAGYKVFWDTKPRASNNNSYTNSQDTGNVTSYNVENISNTGTTYFALKAKDTSNNESDFSVEVYKTPGDVDRNGSVNIFDYNTLKTNFGQTNCDNVADIDLNCNVNIFDYNALKTNFGAHI